MSNNHPNNESFSNRDIKWLVENRQVEYFSIVKNNGSVEMLYMPNDMNIELLKNEYNRLVKKYKNDIENNEQKGYNKVVKNLLEKSKSGLKYVR